MEPSHCAEVSGVMKEASGSYWSCRDVATQSSPEMGCSNIEETIISLSNIYLKGVCGKFWGKRKLLDRYPPPELNSFWLKNLFLVALEQLEDSLEEISKLYIRLSLNMTFHKILYAAGFAKRRPAPPVAQKSGVQAEQDQTDKSIENE
ncbi:ycf2-A Protein [Nymphaea thermarum]|nr:ycf2-A Protein [Nymphaea thermarum]